MAELTPNTNVNSIESGAFSVLDMLYATYLRDLLVQAVDDPEHMYDDRLLAATDGAANYGGE